MRKPKPWRVVVALPILVLAAAGTAYQAANSVAPSHAGVTTVPITTPVAATP